MANINSNVITLKKTKQLLSKSSDVWSGNIKEYVINVTNELDVVLSLVATTVISTDNRTINIVGLQSPTETTGESVSGVTSFGGNITFNSYKMANSEFDVQLDVRKFKYIKITIQMGGSQTLSAFIYSGKIDILTTFETFNAVKISNFKISTKNKKWLRVIVENLSEGSVTPRVDVRFYKNNVEVIKQVYAVIGNLYQNTRIQVSYPVGNRISDNLIDVSDVDSFELTDIAAGTLGVYFNLFEDRESEYKRKPLKTPLALKAFDWIKFKAPTNAPVFNIRDSVSSELATFYNSNKEVMGSLANFNVPLGKDSEVYANVKHLNAVFWQETPLKYEPVFNFSVPEIIEVQTNDNVSLRKVNAVAPVAQYNLFKAYINRRTNELRITDTGASYYDAEYRKLLINVNSAGSSYSVLNMVMIPYKTTESGPFINVRLCIQFDDGNIYHNFPNRSTTGQGSIQAGDIIEFEQSVVWDNVGLFPTKNQTPASGYYYDPSLHADNYELVTPISATSPFGNNGFPLIHPTTNRVRMRKNGYQTFLKSLNGWEITPKITAFDSYYSPTKNGYFETSDGGRQWFLQGNIGTDGVLAKHYGNLNTTGLVFDGTIEIKKVTLINPSEADKDPVNSFSISAGKAVSGIESADNPSITVTAHGLAVNDRVIFTGTSTGYGFLLNNTHNQTSAGNNQVYRVSQVVNANTIKIRPMSSNPNAKIECTHTHAVNIVYDGFLVSCGEEYPKGWIYYLPNKNSDIMAATSSHLIRPIHRLTSTANSVQRAVGFLMLADDLENPTCLFASDSPGISTPIMKVGERNIVSRSSFGLYRGKLADLDNINLYKPIVEFSDGMLGLKLSNDTILAVGGASSSFAVSQDYGKTFKKFRWNVLSGFPSVAGYNEKNEMVFNNGFILSSK